MRHSGKIPGIVQWVDYIELSPDYGILELPTHKTRVGKTLKDLNVRAKVGVNIIAVESGGSTYVSPAAEHKL